MAHHLRLMGHGIRMPPAESYNLLKGATPGEVVGLAEFVTPPVVLPLGFAPERDGLQLLETQRAASAEFHGGFCAIGGAAELVTVTRGGVTKRVLRQWPDSVGARIAA